MTIEASFHYLPESAFLLSSKPFPKKHDLKPTKTTSPPQSPKPKQTTRRHPKQPPFYPILTTIVSQDPNARISTRPSPAPWADGPYQLIPTLRRREMNGAVYCAIGMTNVHNMILRGLNSILRQAPHVPDASRPGYIARDVEDLLFYVQAWAKTLEHHHNVEELTFFPAVEEVTGIVGLMDDLEVEHEEFYDGLIALKEYVERLTGKPNEYRWATMRLMINSFAPALTNHLYAEIDFLLAMEKFDSEGLERCWQAAAKMAAKVDDTGILYDVFPFILGNCDRTYEGGNSFPEVPKPMQYAIKKFFSKKHHGAWRFNCCDFSGRPVPLQMLPENRV